MDAPTQTEIRDALIHDGRYALGAYDFLRDGLAVAVARSHGCESLSDEGQVGRHVTGQELSLALRDLAIDRWGRMARPVLRTWRVRSSRDFGEMVYLLISQGAMGKQESDRIEDFDRVFDFSEFDAYEPSLARLGQRHGSD